MSSLDDYISELVVQQQKTNALASTLTEARDTNPDEFARMKKLSEQAAIDMAILPDFKKEAEQAAYLQDMNIGKLWATAPKTANALVNPTVAGMAHDDVQNLSALEQAMSATGNFLAGTGKSLTAGLLFRPNAGAYGVLRAGADLLPDVVGDPIANFAAKYSQVATQTANDLTPQTDNRLLRNWYSGVNSLGSNAAALAIYVASGGTVNPLVTMGAQEFGTSYQDARSKGKSGWEGGLYAASNAAIEVGTEQMSVGPMLKMFKPGTQLGKAILEYTLKEQGGEQIATHLQDLNEWAALNPEKTFGDYLRERPGAALDTAMSTLVSSGLQSGAAKIVQKVVSKTASIDEADKGAQKLANAMALAAQSKLRERSPETFQQLVETMTEGPDGKPQSVFIDANVLLQSATPEQLVEILPSVAEQLQDSATANGTLEVSIGEALTALPGTPLEQVFLQNARSAPDALSLAEATQAAEQAEAFLKQEAERVMQQASDKAAWQQSAEAVKTTIKQQLDAAGRFTPDVNDAYATLQQHFFSSMAARLGITPQEMYDRWSLKVGAQSQQAAESYEANGAPTKGRYGITVEGRHFSREQRYALSSKMYGTGLKGDMRDKIMNHSDKRLRDRIYFYVDKGTGINPERGVGGVQHKATLDNIYDLDSDPLRIWKGEDKFLDFESAVLDAGYSGYLARNNGSPASGVVIMLGDRNINVEQLSETDDPKSAKGVGAPAARPSYGRDVVVDAINANKKNFPMGAPTRARWAEILQKQMPEEYEALRAAGVFDGDQGKALYLSNLMTEFKNATEAPSYAQSLSSRLPGGKKATEDPLTETPAARVMFEVAPDPNDAALTAEWNALSPEERLALSQQVAAQIVPKVLKELGTGGDFVMQLGGYMGATNPSMTLRLERPELALTAAKLLGYALAQDSMMVVSENQIVGTDEVGAVTIKLPEGYGEAEVTALYDRLYELQANGEPLVGGHTTADGQMVILNYSPLTTEELAATIFNHLGAEFDVDTNVVYSAFPTKDNYGYGQTDAPPEGNTAARQSPAQKRPDRLRSEATQQLRAALDARRAADGTATNRPIEQAARDVTQTPEFKAWFGDSKVVGENGEPLVVYHGTGADFDAFDTNRVGDVFDDDNVGFFFSSSAETASGYATHAAKKNNGAANVMPAYLSLQNPYTFHDYAYSYAYDENSSTLADDITDGRLLIDWFDRNKDTITQHAVEDGKDGMLLVRGNETLAVAFTPTQIKSATGNNGNFDGNDPNILKQNARGTFNPQTLLISLGEASDLSTFLHESGHFFLEVMADIASAPDAPQDVVDDMNKVLAWFGVPDLATWNGYTLDQKRKHHEKWAESFEAYLFEGKAPSAELQPLFRRFRSWLVNVYKSLKQFMQGRDLGLNDDLRQVFDRMLATDAQIARAEEAAGMLPDFDATNEAIEKLQARSLRDLKWTVNARTKSIKALQKQAADLRKGVEAEVRAEVEQQPVYAARKALRSGTKLGIDGLEALYMGEGDRYALLDWKPLVDQKLAGKTGMHPDIAADLFGFANGDALVRELLSAEPIDSVIQGITDRRMLERHGELVDQRAIEEAANDAIHNEARARALATELKSQSEMMNQRQDTGRTASNGRAITVNALTEAAKQFGADLASRRKIRDLKSAAWQHRAAEARAGKAWQEHTAAGKTEDAVRAKRDQLLNNHAAKALQEAQVEARKVLEFFRRVTKDGNEKTVEKGRDPDVVNAMRAILSAYGIAPRQGKSALEYMEIMAKNDPAMHGALAAGVNAALANAKPVDQMTMEELRGLNDEMRAMWYLAKRSRQMEVAGDLMDIEDAANELVVRMAELGVPVEVPGESGAMTPKEKAIRGLQHVGSLLRRVEQWAEGMDGKFGGPFLRLVFQPVKEAANRYRADRVKYRKRYQALVDAVGPYLRKGVIEAPELRYTFGKGHNGIGHAELLHAILHTGNESNKRKLLLGRKWATENADGTLDTTQWDAFINRMVNDGTLTKAHYDFAQGVWDLLEETKPLAQKAHRDVFGRYFAEVTADAFDTPFGQYRGGYVPAQADPRIVPDADMRDLVELENENMMFSFPATNRGFTKSRTEYNRPLMLDLRTIGQHIDKVLLFAHMEPHVRDVNKLLRQKGVSYSLNRIDPTAVPGMLTPWLKRSARQIVETPWVGDGGVSRVASVLRNRAGMALMFANVSNAIQQVTGFSTAFAKLKADGLQSHMMRATAQFIASPKETSRNVAQASSFMEGRMENEIAAINEAMDDILLDPNLYQKAQAWTRKHAYFLQSAFANTMEPIIWTAAYNAALEKGMEQDDAVRYADGLIRQTQGSTLPEDVSRAETGPAVLRMFTQFVGYFNMMANTNATGLKQIANEVGLKKGAGRALHLVTTGLLVPIWVAEAIAVAMRGGPEDEDDDGYLDDWLAAVFGFGTIKGMFAMVPVFGQAANAAVNRFNSNPADDRISASPAVSLLEAGAGVPSLLYKAMTDPDKINKRNAVRDVASAISLGTGLPAYAVARPLGYLAGVADERIEPTGPVDAVRGAVTGTPSPESR